MKSRTIALLSDFGSMDPFAGIMKGVIVGLIPNARLIDITHDIPPGDVLRAAVALWQSVPFFPRGTVFLAVVDPGVGTSRKPIIIKSAGNIYIGPDNGLFTLVIKQPYDAYEISNYLWESYDISTTFHGRDIFAPVAALSSTGERSASFGPKLAKLEELEQPYLATTAPSEITGEILYPDRFGNLLTSLGKFTYKDNVLSFRPWVGNQAEPTIVKNQPKLVLPDGTSLPFGRTFSDIPPGECRGVIGSSGLIEIVANQSSAADLIGLEPGDQISLVY